MYMDVNQKFHSSFNINYSHMKKEYGGFFAKKQDDLLTFKEMIKSLETKSNTSEEEESVTFAANKRMLKSLLEIAGATSASVYTEESIRDLADTMSKAAAVSVSKNARSSDVAKALSQLRSSMGKLRVAEKKDKKGNASEMLGAEIIKVNGAVSAAQDAKNAASFNQVAASFNNVSVSISTPAAAIPTVDVSL